MKGERREAVKLQMSQPNKVKQMKGEQRTHNSPIAAWKRSAKSAGASERTVALLKPRKQNTR
jgi:hypothetical protein